MELETIKESCINGSSEMVTDISSGIVTFLFNIVMIKYMGEKGVAAITIILYSQFVFIAVYLGFSMGTAPIISYNYGNKNQTYYEFVNRSIYYFSDIFKIYCWFFYP